MLALLEAFSLASVSKAPYTMLAEPHAGRQRGAGSKALIVG